MRHFLRLFLLFATSHGFSPQIGSRNYPIGQSQFPQPPTGSSPPPPRPPLENLPYSPGAWRQIQGQQQQVQYERGVPGRPVVVGPVRKEDEPVPYKVPIIQRQRQWPLVFERVEVTQGLQKYGDQRIVSPERFANTQYFNEGGNLGQTEERRTQQSPPGTTVGNYGSPQPGIPFQRLNPQGFSNPPQQQNALPRYPVAPHPGRPLPPQYPPASYPLTPSPGQSLGPQSPQLNVVSRYPIQSPPGRSLRPESQQPNSGNPFTSPGRPLVPESPRLNTQPYPGRQVVPSQQLHVIPVSSPSLSGPPGRHLPSQPQQFNIPPSPSSPDPLSRNQLPENFQETPFQPSYEGSREMHPPSMTPQGSVPLPSYKTLRNAPPGSTFISIRNMDGSMKYAVDPIPPTPPPRNLSFTPTYLGPGEHLRPGHPPNPRALYTNPANPLQLTSDMRPPEVPLRRPSQRTFPSPQQPYLQHQQQQQQFFHPGSNMGPYTVSPLIQQQLQQQPKMMRTPPRRTFQESTAPLPMHNGGYTLLQQSSRDSSSSRRPSYSLQEERVSHPQFYFPPPQSSSYRDFISPGQSPSNTTTPSYQQRYFQPPPQFFPHQRTVSQVPGGSRPYAYAPYGEDRSIPSRRNQQETFQERGSSGAWYVPPRGGVRPPPLSSPRDTNPYSGDAGGDNPYSFDYSPSSSSGRSINPYAQLSSYARPPPPPEPTSSHLQELVQQQRPPNPQETTPVLLPRGGGEVPIHPEHKTFDNGGLFGNNATKEDQQPSSHSAILQQYLQRAKQKLREQQQKEFARGVGGKSEGKPDDIPSETSNGTTTSLTDVHPTDRLPATAADASNGGDGRGVPVNQLQAGGSDGESLPGLFFPTSEPPGDVGRGNDEFSKLHGRRRRHHKGLRRRTTSTPSPINMSTNDTLLIANLSELI